MIKKRFGDDFATSISANIEIRAADVTRKDNKGGKRKPKGDQKERKERKPREEKKEEAPAATDAREGRRRGAREGQ